jgi:hypothetical protein
MDSNPSSEAAWGDYLNASLIQIDAGGNIYYLDYEGSIIKLDISNPENITSVPYAASNRDRVGAFKITPDGHVIYKYISTTVSTTYGTRIRSNSGAIKNLPESTWLFWIGLDGKIYYYDYDWTVGGYIKRVEIDNGEFITTNFADTEEDENEEMGYPLGHYMSSSMPSNYELNMPDKIILVSTEGRIVEVDNPERKPVGLVDGNTYTALLGVGASDRYCYLAASNKSNDPSIYKIDPITNTALALLAVGTYEVYSLSVGKDDYVYFHAMKMANGADVIGEIDSNGIVTIVSENADSREIKSLVRLY